MLIHEWDLYVYRQETCTLILVAVFKFNQKEDIKVDKYFYDIILI